MKTFVVTFAFCIKEKYLLILSLFNLDSRIGSVIDSCFIVGITIGCDIELKSVVDLATNERIAFFVFVMFTWVVSSYYL